MTEDEIRNMEAGREMDALIMEMVIGIKPCDPYGVEPYIILHKLPYFSTDIAAAWQVVEKMQGDDFWWSSDYKTGIYINDFNRPGYFVRFRCIRAGERGDHFAAADSVSLAICRAALLAVMEKKE